MKALVLAEYGLFEYRDVPDPEPADDEVVVAVRACGICGSDVHGMDGSTGRRIPPIVMGHEAAGVVAAVGPGVTAFRVGDRVTFDSTIYCGDCFFCRRGQINLCDQRQVLGVSCGEYRRDGAFAELVAVPERIVYPLPEGLGFEQAAMTEAVSVAVHAVGLLTPALNESALVVGAGMIGLLAVQALRAAGCGRIIAVDVAPERLERARALGADTLIEAGSCDVRDRVTRATGGRGADLGIEAVGRAETVQTAIGAMRKGGRLALVGNLAASVELPLQAVVTRQIALFGSCASAGEYPACLDMLARGVFDLEPVMSAVAPLSEGAEWFRRLHGGEPGLMKVLLKP